MSMVRRWGKRLFATVSLITLSAIIGFLVLCVLVDQYGKIDRVERADVIVILGAHVLPNGEPGPDLLPRTEKAVRLFQAGYAPSLICTGGIAGDHLSAAAVACRKAVQLGVPGDVIFIADGSNNTREDVRRAAAIMRDRKWNSVVVVSHPMHLLRAVLLFRHAGVDVYPSPTSTEVEAIPLRWQVVYAVREAGLILLDVMYPEGEIADWAYSVYYWLRDVGLDVRM